MIMIIMIMITSNMTSATDNSHFRDAKNNKVLFQTQSRPLCSVVNLVVNNDM